MDREEGGPPSYVYHGSKTTFKIVKTIFMVLAPAVMGIYLELTGPTLQELMKRVDANYEQISLVLVARSVGYLVGSLVCGPLADRFHQHLELLLSVALLFGTVGTFLSPWCPVLELLAVMFLVQGIGQGMIDTSNNTLCLVMWGKDAAAPIHALHFGFGIGAFIAPQLARPFLKSSDNDTFNSTINSSTTEETSPIEVPYSISAVLTLTWCLIFLGFYVHSRITSKKVKTEKSEEEAVKIPLCKRAKMIISPGTCTNGDSKFGVVFFGLLFFFYMSIVGGERAYGKFLYSYAEDGDLEFTVDEASTLNSLFWICFTCGRGLAIVAAQWISPTYLLTFELSFNILACVALAIWGYSEPMVLWVFTGVLGLFLAPVFPAGMAFANQYAVMTGTAVSLVFIGSSVGGMVYQYLTGYLFEYYGPQTLMYIMVGYSISLSLVTICLFILVRGRSSIGKSFLPNDQGLVDTNNVDNGVQLQHYSRDGTDEWIMQSDQEQTTK